MGVKFLYIDDESEVTARGLITNLDREPLEFNVERPLTWNRQRKILIEDRGLDQYDGLLLDFKLEFSDEGNDDVKYFGSELAQAIRNGAKSNSIKDIPIFLCSTDDLYIAFFDRTSIDLFDKKYKKESTLNTDQTKLELIAFANAYNRIAEDRSTDIILNRKSKSNDDIQILDLELNKFQTPHEIVYLLHHYFIRCPGLLVDEDLLAIRLGVDKAQSSDWGKFKKEVLIDFTYTGILGDCYPRWWQHEITEWWDKTFEKNLIAMDAADKVEEIAKKFDLNLVPLSLPTNQKYSSFWYKCRLSDIPLDPTDGLRTIEMPRYAWQEPSYISISYLLSEERDLKKINELLGPSEREYFGELDKN